MPGAGVFGCSFISGSSGQKREGVRAVPRLSTHRPPPVGPPPLIVAPLFALEHEPYLISVRWRQAYPHKE